MPKVRDLISILSVDFNPDDTIAFSLWTEKDVESLNAQENRNRRLGDNPEIILQPEDVEYILERMHDEFDADQELNNDSLHYMYMEIIGNLQEVEQEDEEAAF